MWINNDQIFGWIVNKKVLFNDFTKHSFQVSSSCFKWLHTVWCTLYIGASNWFLFSWMLDSAWGSQTDQCPVLGIPEGRLLACGPHAPVCVAPDELSFHMRVEGTPDLLNICKLPMKRADFCQVHLPAQACNVRLEELRGILHWHHAAWISCLEAIARPTLPFSWVKRAILMPKVFPRCMLLPKCWPGLCNGGPSSLLSLVCIGDAYWHA